MSQTLNFEYWRTLLMKPQIDCLFIGPNEVNFQDYEQMIRKMGEKSGAYRDLSRSFITMDDKPYLVLDMFNLFYAQDRADVSPLILGDTFSPAIAYLATYIHRRGLTFDYVNSFQEEKELLAKKLTENKVLTVAITTTLYFISYPILEIIKFIKKYNTTAKIIIGGPFVKSGVLNAKSEQDLELFFNSIEDTDVYINSSQGEATLVKVIQAFKNNQLLEAIPNLWYKRSGVFEPTPIKMENNLLEKNMVDWSLFQDRLTEYIGIRTSISCLFSCSYCGYPEHAGKYQNVSLEGFEKELCQLEDFKVVKDVHFIDDTFNVPLNRFKEILRMMIKNKFSFKWNSNLRCQFLDRETAELMKESGCEGVYLGIESGNDTILKNMNKATTVDRYRRGIEILKEYEIPTMGSFIVGFPGETYKTFQDTVNFIKETRVDFYRAHLWYCWSITPIWREKDKYKLIGSNFEWSHATMDSKTAANLLDELFLSIDNSIWVPQYSFDFDNIFHMVHRGLPMEKAKEFLRAFNMGIKEKIENPTKKNFSYDILRKMKKALIGSEVQEDSIFEKYEADFLF